MTDCATSPSRMWGNMCSGQSQGGGGGLEWERGGSGSQKFVYQKWPDKICQQKISWFPTMVTLGGLRVIGFSAHCPGNVHRNKDLLCTLIC